MMLKPLPEWTCHKVVRAFKIGRMDNFTLYSDCGNYQAEVSHKFMQMHAATMELTEGYYVLYADGYASFSPTIPFEDGYKRGVHHMPDVFFKLGKIEGCRYFSYDDESVFVDVPAEFVSRYNFNQAGYIVVRDGELSFLTVPETLINLRSDKYNAFNWHTVIVTGDSSVQIGAIPGTTVVVQNEPESARVVRGLSVNKIHLVGVKDADLNPTLREALDNSTVTHQQYGFGEVKFEEV